MIYAIIINFFIINDIYYKNDKKENKDIIEKTISRDKFRIQFNAYNINNIFLNSFFYIIFYSKLKKLCRKSFTDNNNLKKLL